MKIEVVDCNLPEPEANYEAWVEENGRPAPEFPGIQSQQEQATAGNMPVPVLERKFIFYFGLVICFYHFLE